MKKFICILLVIITVTSLSACGFGSLGNPTANCSMEIDEILTLSDDDLLASLSEHLGEMTDWGTYTDILNEYEKVVYYADELNMEVNCGGFYYYFYNCGENFEKAKQSFAAIKDEDMLSLMDTLERKFPGKKVPNTNDAIRTALEENNLNFDTEDDLFYDTVMKGMLNKLTTYIIENKEHFR